MGNRGPLTRLLQQRYDALKADNDRLRRELEQARAELDSVNRSEDAIQAGSALKYLLELQRELAMARAELERLREVRAGSLRAGIGGNLCIEGVSDSFIAAIPEELLAQLKMARAELARMRPVVEAAADFDEWCGDERCASGTCRIARAMNEYRASTGKEGEDGEPSSQTP